jgi:NNP family nitrate/nitrite transporter-like MFS transporter
MALVQTAAGYIITSLFIGIVGASFVITQYHTTAMFAGKCIGTANATSAGWGNFGGGCANFFMPLLFFHFVNDYGVAENVAWRICMLIPACGYLVMAAIYWFFTVDRPPKAQVSPKDIDVNVMNDPDPTLSNKKVDKSKGGFMAAVKDYRTCYYLWYMQHVLVLN